MSTDFDELLIHPATKNQLLAFLGSPKHALLITGSAGLGKKTLAESLASGLLTAARGNLYNYPYFYPITKDSGKNEISIDAIRQLINRVNLKVPTEGAAAQITRVALIENAESLSREAQNALLKLLEEPPAGTLIILTAESDSGLLPTVASRAQKIKIIPAGLDESKEYFKSSYEPAAIESAWRLSGGGAGLMSALLADDTTHPLKIAVDNAKIFLSQSTYQRLIYLKDLSKNKDELYAFMDALGRILSALQSNALRSGSTANAKRLLQARKLVHRQLMPARSNVNLRLLAVSLVLNIPV